MLPQTPLLDAWGARPRLRYIPSHVDPSGNAKQEAFIRYPGRELLFGGAAGGGKSVGLLAAGLQYIDVPGYAALILRRTYADLNMPGALMSMSHDWLDDSPARWRNDKHTWEFPSTATLTFGYLRNEQDLARYKSTEFQYLGFDELTEFDEHLYTFLFSRQRRGQDRGSAPDGTTLAMVPIRCRAATNPGGPGREWVRSRFVDPETRTSPFLPATLDDNPFLDQDSYLVSLGYLGPVDYARLRHGDWDAVAEGEISGTWFRLVDHSPASVRAVRAWDLASTEIGPDSPDPDRSVGTRYELQPDGRFTVADVVRGAWNPGQLERVIRQTAELDGTDVHVLIEVEPGSSGKIAYSHLTRRVLRGYAVSGNRPTGDKWVRARPAIAAAANGLIDVVKGSWTREWIDRVSRMAPGNKVHDDELDSWSAAHTYLSMGASRQPRVHSAASVRIPTGAELLAR